MKDLVLWQKRHLTMAKHKLTEEEKKEWGALYEYLKKEIFHYDENQKLSDTIVLSVLGIRYGKAVENTKIKDKAKYPFRVIMYTFIACKPSIEYALKTKNFKSESSMMSYIGKIINGKINEVYEKDKQARKENEMYIKRLEYIDSRHTDRNKKMQYKSSHKEVSNRLKKYF